MQDNCSLHQNDVVNSPVRAGLRHQYRFPRPCRFTMPRPTHLSEPPLMMQSSLLSVSRGLVYIDIPGRTCLHELFIGYEQVTAWVARFSFKLEANYHQPPFALDGSMGRRTSRCHYSFVNFKSPVGRNHWPSCWHGSSGIINNPPRSPQPSVDSHRAINTNDIQVMPVYITVKYGESQANSSSHLETWGLQ